MPRSSARRCCSARIKSYDATKALAFPGVEQVVEMPRSAADKPVEFKALGGLAVIASNTWAANEGRKLLEIEWDDGANGVVRFRQPIASAGGQLQEPGRRPAQAQAMSGPR